MFLASMLSTHLNLHDLLQAKSESTIARLEAELNELKIYHRKELDKLNHKAEQATKDSKELRNQLREKEQVGFYSKRNFLMLILVST